MMNFFKRFAVPVKHREGLSGAERVSGSWGWRKLLVAALLSGSAGVVHAQTASEALAQVQAADAVFLGSLRDKESFSSDDGRLIWTRHLFAVQETLRGPAQDTIEIFELGGTVGDVSLTVSHGASYEFARPYLIFARRDEGGRLQTWGGPEGRLTVLQDGSGKSLVRLGTASPLRALMPNPERAFYDLSEIREKLAELKPNAEEAR